MDNGTVSNQWRYCQQVQWRAGEVPNLFNSHVTTLPVFVHSRANYVPHESYCLRVFAYTLQSDSSCSSIADKTC